MQVHIKQPPQADVRIKSVKKNFKNIRGQIYLGPQDSIRNLNIRIHGFNQDLEDLLSRLHVSCFNSQLIKKQSCQFFLNHHAATARLKRGFYLKYMSRRQPFEFTVESFQPKILFGYKNRVVVEQGSNLQPPSIAHCSTTELTWMYRFLYRFCPRKQFGWEQ